MKRLAFTLLMAALLLPMAMQGQTADTCMGPSTVRVSAISSTQVTLAWTDSNHTDNYRIVLNGDVAGALVTYDTTITFGVAADSLYTVQVGLLCNGQYTTGVSLTFRTPCEAIAHDELPWGEDFEEVESSWQGGLEVDCMRFLRSESDSVSYPFVYDGSHYGDGGHSLFFYPQAGEPQVAVLPMFDDSIGMLMFSAQIRVSDLSNAFELGVMTNPCDASTFVVVDTLEASSPYSWTYVEHDFGNYGGPGGYMALRPKDYNAATGTILMIEEITVAGRADCVAAQAVTTSNCTPTTVTVNIVDTNYVGTYRVWLTSDADSAERMAEISDYSVDFYDLLPHTQYVAHAAALCYGAATADVTTAFATPCSAAAMPWEENFNEVNPSIGPQYLSGHCWGFYNGAAGQVDSVMAGVGHLQWGVGLCSIHEGDGTPFATRHLIHIYVGSGRYMWTVTPSVAVSESAVLSFDMALTQMDNGLAPSGNMDDDRFVVAVTADYGASWTPLAMWGNDTEGRDDYLFSSIPVTGESVSLSLDDFVGQEVRIGFYSESTVGGSDDALRIDNIVVENADCPSPRWLTIESVEPTTAVLEWRGEGSSYDYGYRAAGTSDTGWTMAATTDTTVTLTGLSPHTEYLFRVRSNCGVTTSRWVEVPLTTLNTYITELPYRTGFEEGEDTDWMSFDVDSVNEWFVGTAAHRSGCRALYISNDGGSTNAYTNNSVNTYSFAYRTFELPAGKYAVSFDWRALGEGQYDFLRAFIVPDNESLTGVQVTYDHVNSSRWIPLDNHHGLNMENEWQTVNSTFMIYPGGRYKLVFLWRNNRLRGENPPAAIDNVLLKRLTCNAPVNLTFTEVTENSVGLGWSPMGGEDRWVVRVDDGEWNTVDEPHFTATGLAASARHSFAVCALCGPGDTSFALQGAVYTRCGAILSDALPWREDFNSVQSLDDLECWNRYSGLYDSVAPTLTPGGGWTIYDKYMNHSRHAKLNYWGRTGIRSWLVTPVVDLTAPVVLSFDYLLTQYGQGDSAMDVGSDDRFMVLLTADEGETWNILARWDSEDDAFAAISPHVTRARIPLDAFIGHRVRIAFYGESTVANGDYDLHIDNVGLTIGNPDIGIGDKEETLIAVDLYPNPVTSTVSVRVNDDGPSWMALLDMHGRECGRWSMEKGERTINVGLLPRGTYLLRIATPMGTVTKKLIVQ